MKLKCDFDILNLGDEIVAVPVGNSAKDFRGVVKMNDSANVIFQLLKDDQTEDTILKTLEEHYDTSTSELREYIDNFITELKKQDLLSE